MGNHGGWGEGLILDFLVNIGLGAYDDDFVNLEAPTTSVSVSER